jgi:hypothetical protein
MLGLGVLQNTRAMFTYAQKSSTVSNSVTFLRNLDQSCCVARLFGLSYHSVHLC